jgi:hypothetical protein
MAKLTGGILFTGSLEGLNAYKDPNSDDIIIRKKGGPTVEQIKNSSQFENTRRCINEFGGCSTASRFIRSGLKHLKPLMHKDLAGQILAHIKPLLKEDKQNEWGNRSFYFGRNPQLLTDYNLNSLNPFDSVVLKPINSSLSRNAISSSISIPALNGESDLNIPGHYNTYRFVAGISILPDLFSMGKKYHPSHSDYDRMPPAIISSEWYSKEEGSPELQFEITYPKTPVNNAYSLMLSIGIYFGKATYAALNQEEEIAGSAKIIAVQ